MKKTTLTMTMVFLGLFLISGVYAQHSPEVLSIKENLQEVQQNLGPANCQEQISEQKCISGQDRTLLIEKRDYLIQLLDTYSVNDQNDGSMSLISGFGRDGVPVDADRMDAIKFDMSNDMQRSAPALPKGTSVAASDAAGMTAAQSTAWNQLTNAENGLKRAMKNPNSSPEIIAAWQNRIEVLKKQLID